MQGNDITKSNESEVNLKILIAYTFKHWKIMLLAGLTLGLVISLYKGIQYKSNYSNMDAAYNVEYESYNNQKQVYESGIQDLEKSISSLKNYTENSIYLQLNPDNEVKTISALFVKWNGDSSVNVKQITSAYNSYISNMNYDELSGKLNIESQYIKELVQVKCDYDTNTVSVAVVGNDAELTESIAAYIDTQVKNKKSDIQDQFGDHELAFADLVTSKVSAFDLFNDENVLKTNGSSLVLTPSETSLDKIYTEIDNINKSITATEKSLASLSEPVSPRKEITKGIVKNFGIGFFGMILLLILFYAMKFIFSNKIKSEEELANRYQIRSLAVYPMASKTKRIYAFDKIVMKSLDNSYGMKNQDVSEIANINLLQAAENKKNILFVFVNVDDTSEIANIEKFKGNFNSKITTNVKLNAQELEKLKNADGVVIVLKRFVTRYEDLSLTIEMVNNWDKPILGTITY